MKNLTERKEKEMPDPTGLTIPVLVKEGGSVDWKKCESQRYTGGPRMIKKNEWCTKAKKPWRMNLSRGGHSENTQPRRMDEQGANKVSDNRGKQFRV